MVMSMRQGKQNQHSKVEYMGCMRNTNLILIKLENEGPKLDKLALYIIILII